MLPFSLKIAWLVLSSTGLIVCWIVLWAFGRAVDAQWGPITYCIGNTLLQGVFCLGMIYRMDPFQMPRAFCIAQTIFISFGAYLITGVALAFSLATNMTVLKPKTWADGQRAMQWHNVYAIPIVVFPVLASIIHITVLFKLDSVHPTDDLHCDSTHPEWVRFLGYAGVPFFMSLPSLYLSVRSIKRVYKTNQHLQRARPDSVDGFTSAPRSSRTKRELSFIGRTVVSSAPTSRREPISPALLAQKFHLPFKTPSAPEAKPRRESSQFSMPDLDGDDASSQVSASFPTFTNPGSGTLMEGEERAIELGNVDDSAEQKPECYDVELVVPGGSDSVHGDKDWNESKIDLRSMSDVAKEEYIMSAGEPPYSLRSFSTNGMPHRRPRRQPPNLAPAVWRIILFQIAFTIMQFLTCFSTFIDVVTRRSTPMPLGTQHFALLLAAWGPVLVFGHLPAVRRNLIPWRPVS